MQISEISQHHKKSATLTLTLALALMRSFCESEAQGYPSICVTSVDSIGPWLNSRAPVAVDQASFSTPYNTLYQSLAQVFRVSTGGDLV